MPRATTTKTPPRTRRNKTEVQQELADIQDEMKAARDTADAKADEVARRKEGEIRQAAEGVTVEGTVEQISRLGLEVSRALSGISEKLVDEVNRLTTLRAAVELERAELERLHKIDVAATALDLLVQEYEQQKAQIQTEMAAQRTVWEENVSNTERDRKEQEDALKKQRQREIDEYEYKKNLERKRSQDKYEEEIRQQEKKNRERQEALEKSWAQREAVLHEQEEELQRLRKEGAEFPARLERELQQASAQASKEARQQADQKMQIAQKDAESDRRMAELQIKTLEDLLARQTVQISEMQKQLDEAKRQVQEIAVRAIEGASGAKTRSLTSTRSPWSKPSTAAPSRRGLVAAAPCAHPALEYSSGTASKDSIRLKWRGIPSSPQRSHWTWAERLHRPRRG
jgi:DNA repair exonuclease SbcCD ATPase subunit